MTDYRLHITYVCEGRQKSISASVPELELQQTVTKNRICVQLKAHKPLQIRQARLEIPYTFEKSDRFFANGYQSWTDTKVFARDEKMPDIGRLGKLPFGKKFGFRFVGDYTFADYSKKPGVFHSNSYAYVEKEGEIDFFGSLSDRTGWTVLEANMPKNRLSVLKDVQGVTFQGDYTLFDLYVENGSYDAVFDHYFTALQIQPLPAQKIKGYTSWYNYYQDIEETLILRDLKAFSAHPGLINTFQIDDGYQTAVGDWLSVDAKKFPNGMQSIANVIHEQGLQAGIWLAPFGAQKDSAVAKMHPDWLLKNRKGKPFFVGGNWGGFCALDIYNPQVRDYIRHCFDVVLHTWGFDLVKLDFLYAASVLPRNNKSRGEIMYDAIDFIRECVGDKKILACGVPMMPCFGKVEYMRIGADMTHQWQDSKYRKKMHREDTSTVNAIYNSIYRRHLNGRAFLCDPDVFLLRDYNIHFSFEERKLLAKLIKIFGSVLFTSDDISRYDEAQTQVLLDTLSQEEVHLKDVSVKQDVCTVVFTEDGVEKRLCFNIKTGEACD